MLSAGRLTPTLVEDSVEVSWRHIIWHISMTQSSEHGKCHMSMTNLLAALLQFMILSGRCPRLLCG